MGIPLSRSTFGFCLEHFATELYLNTARSRWSHKNLDRWNKPSKGSVRAYLLIVPELAFVLSFLIHPIRDELMNFWTLFFDFDRYTSSLSSTQLINNWEVHLLIPRVQEREQKRARHALPPWNAIYREVSLLDFRLLLPIDRTTLATKAIPLTTAPYRRHTLGRLGIS